MMSWAYIGSFFGLILFSYISDNYGRFLGSFSSWITAAIGALLVGVSTNIALASVGLFLGGFGINASTAIHYSFLNE